MGLIQGLRIGVVLLTLAGAFSAGASGLAKIQMRSEENRWIVEQIGTASDGWPEVQKRASFPSQTSAQIKLQNWQAGNTSLQTLDISVQPKMAAGVLWETRNQWSQDWEDKFGKWVEAEADADFYMRNQIATDCADVAYSLRWIFSRINGLPAGANLGGSSMFMTNETVRPEWAKLPTSTEWNKDQRFLKALNYLLDMTYTHTLWDNSFPVALNRHDLISGSYHLNLHDSSGHTQIIRWFDQDSKVPFITLNSTTPRKVRQLMEMMLSADFPKPGQSGLLRFRWPVKTAAGISLKRSVDMPGYSLEQFSMKSQKEFTIALFEKMGYATDVNAISELLLKDIIGQMNTRIDIVKEGAEKCKKTDCRPGTDGYEDWSTPSRDARIAGKMATMESLVIRSSGSEVQNPLLNKEILSIEGTVWSLKALLWNWKHEVYSSDPMDSESRRWGAGNQSWVQDQKKFFATQLAARDAQLKKSAELCTKQDCSLFSPLWSTLSSSKIDSEIRRRTIYLLGGEGKFPAASIASLKAAGAESVYAARGNNVSLGFLMKNQPAMNSSPLVSYEEQWGLSKEAMPMPVGEKPYFEKWLYASDEPKRILSLSREPIALPGKLVMAIPKEPILLLKDDNGFKLFDLTTSEVLPLSLPAGFEVKTSGDSLILTVGENQTLLLKLATGPLRIAKQETLNLAITTVYDNYDTLGTAEGEIIDLTSGHHMLAGAGAGILGGNDKFILTENVAGEKKIFDRATGAVTPLIFEGKINSVSSDLRVILAMKERNVSHLHFLDDKFNPRAEVTLQGFCFIQSATNLVGCWSPSTNGQILYAIEKDSVRKMDFGANVVWVSDKYVCRAPSDDSMQLFERDTNKLLFGGSRIILMANDLIGVSFKGDRYGNMLSMKNPKVPVLSNMFPVGWWWSSKVLDNGQGIIINDGSNGSIWLKGQVN
jgi:hypothetical protein